MKPEPLKGKIKKFPRGLRTIRIFELDDVKSAVQGLLEEIERRKEKLKEDLEYERDKLRKAEDEMEEDVAQTCIDFIKVRLDELCEIEKQIKKWFADVFEEVSRNDRKS